MTDIIQMSKDGKKFYPQTHVQAVIGLQDSLVGTNLLLKTYEPFSMTGNNTANQSVTMYKVSRTLEKGTTLTLSFDAVSTAPASFIVLNLGGTWQSYLTDTVDTKKKHYVATITLNESAKLGLNLKFNNVPSTTTVTISNMKLELGSNATDYSLNPLDIATDGSVQMAIANALGKVATINVISQADYDKLADKSGVYFIKG